VIICESFLTTFKSSVVYRGSWGRTVNWLKTKIEPPQANLVCPNPWNALSSFWKKELSSFFEMLINWVIIKWSLLKIASVKKMFDILKKMFVVQSMLLTQARVRLNKMWRRHLTDVNISYYTRTEVKLNQITGAQIKYYGGTIFIFSLRAKIEMFY